MKLTEIMHFAIAYKWVKFDLKLAGMRRERINNKSIKLSVKKFTYVPLLVLQTSPIIMKLTAIMHFAIAYERVKFDLKLAGMRRERNNNKSIKLSVKKFTYVPLLVLQTCPIIMKLTAIMHFAIAYERVKFDLKLAGMRRERNNNKPIKLSVKKFI